MDGVYIVVRMTFVFDIVVQKYTTYVCDSMIRGFGELLWFLKQLHRILDTESKITFISYRHPGIIDGVKKVFPDCYHGFYLFHLKYNLIDKLKGVHPTIRNRLVYKLTKCAYAHIVEKCKYWMNFLLSEGAQKVEDFFSGFSIKS